MNQIDNFIRLNSNRYYLLKVKLVILGIEWNKVKSHSKNHNGAKKFQWTALHFFLILKSYLCEYFRGFFGNENIESAVKSLPLKIPV